MILRQATEQDINIIAKILGDWCETTAYIPALHTRAEDRGFITRVVATQDVLVADSDGVQGFIARQNDEINHLYLSPPARGRGTGTALLEEMKTRSDTLSLWCFQANTGARRFYERHGFTAEKFTDGADNEERLPDIHYCWEGTS